jgi:hypothetical protein
MTILEALASQDPELVKFWSKVDRSGECWEWKGARKPPENYGIMGRNVRAHRWIFQKLNGPLPADKPFVCHKCDNPPCVRPDHLFAGSHDDNMRDCSVKKRTIMHKHPEKSSWCGNAIPRVKGERNGTSKLTADQVIEIRRLFDNKLKTVRELTAMYGLKAIGSMWRICKREQWKHLP